MTKNRNNSSDVAPPRFYHRGDDIPLRVIRRYARQIGEHFQPDKIILFGSQAYGKPHVDSDVDLLVIMPAYNQHTQAVRIRNAFPAPFAMDLIVRTPKNLGWRLEEGESFHTEILTKGKVLYEKDNTDFASSIRYPGENASKRDAVSCLRWAGRVREKCRTLLGIRPPRQREST